MKADEHCQVLIVGAGAAGAIAARELALAGCDVLCLEQGGWTSSVDLPGAKLERELITRKDWHTSGNVRNWDEDYPCDIADAEIHPVMFNGVGGGTVHFSAEWPRLAPSDFRTRSQDGVADDWPLTYEDLLPYYERVDELVGASGRGGDTAFPPGASPPLPSASIGKVGRKAAEGFNKLGWHWWPGANAIATERYGSLSACVRRGVCGAGCPEGAKGSYDLTIWPEALAAGARLRTGARTRMICADDAGRARGVEWIDRRGETHTVGANVVVLAANGVGTPRLLLASACGGFPTGLANSSGLVGRRLMMHPFRSVLGVYDDDLDSWLGPFGNILWSMQFRETDWSRGFARGAKWTVSPVPGPLELLARYAELPIQERIGSKLHDIVARGLGRAFDLAVVIEDLPDAANRVTLHPTLTDSDGVPAPKITYRLSEHSRRALQWHVDRATEVHDAAGAVETRAIDWGPQVGWHLLGTARMGDDPATSVVDRHCRAHDIHNLFIIDGSVFVTAGAANPTPTISAIAMRASATILETARGPQSAT